MEVKDARNRSKRGGFFSAAGKERRQERRNVRKIDRLAKKDATTTTAKSLKEKKDLKPTGRIRAGAKSVKVTKGGAYASYDKKSAAASSFRKAYAKAKKGSNFTWDGRKYKK